MLRFDKFSDPGGPPMPDGTSLITLGHPGAERVVEHHNAMGPVKAVPLPASGYASGVTGEILRFDAGLHIESPAGAANSIQDQPRANRTKQNEE